MAELPTASDQIRREFLRFFEENGHRVVPSSSLVPHGDPTLLLTTAGVVQVKPYFTGEGAPPTGPAPGPALDHHLPRRRGRAGLLAGRRRPGDPHPPLRRKGQLLGPGG